MNKKIQLLLISLMLLFTLAAGTGTLPLFNPFLQTDMNGGDMHGAHSITNLNTLSASNVSASATMSLNGQTISNWPVASTNFSLVNGVPGAVSFSGAGVQTNSPGNYTILAGAATNASLVNNTPGSVTLQGPGIVTNGGGVFTITGGTGGVTAFNGLSNNVGYTVTVVASNAFACYLQTNSPTLQFYLTVDTNYATTNWVVSLGYATTGQLASQGVNLTNYVIGLGYVTAAVTNGLATQLYVQALTNAQWSLALSNFQYGSTTLSNLVMQMPAVLNGGGITNLVIPITNYTGTSGVSGLYELTNALGQLWISNYFNTAITNGLVASNALPGILTATEAAVGMTNGNGAAITNLTAATTSTYGVVKYDGSSITVNGSGQLQATTGGGGSETQDMPDAAGVIASIANATTTPTPTYSAEIIQLHTNNGGALTNLTIPMTNYVGTSGLTGIYGVTNALGQLWISNYFNTSLTNGLAAWNTLTNGATEGYIWQYHAGALQWINTNWENGFVQNSTNLLWQSLGTAAQSNASAFQATNVNLTGVAAGVETNILNFAGFTITNATTTNTIGFTNGTLASTNWFGKSNVVQVIGSTGIYAQTLSNNAALVYGLDTNGNVSALSLAGTGDGITSLNGSSVNEGTVPAARIGGNGGSATVGQVLTNDGAGNANWGNDFNANLGNVVISGSAQFQNGIDITGGALTNAAWTASEPLVTDANKTAVSGSVTAPILFSGGAFSLGQVPLNVLTNVENWLTNGATQGYILQYFNGALQWITTNSFGGGGGGTGNLTNALGIQLLYSGTNIVLDGTLYTNTPGPTFYCVVTNAPTITLSNTWPQYTFIVDFYQGSALTNSLLWNTNQTTTNEGIIPPAAGQFITLPTNGTKCFLEATFHPQFNGSNASVYQQPYVQ